MEQQGYTCSESPRGSPGISPDEEHDDDDEDEDVDKAVSRLTAFGLVWFVEQIETGRL